MSDLHHAISTMKGSPGWVNNIFEMKDPMKVKLANNQNKLIAMRILSKTFSACWIVLHTFIGIVKEDNQGTFPSSILHDWLLFQLHPTDIHNTDELFTNINPFGCIFHQLSGASYETLSTLILYYSDCVTEIIRPRSFFVVIDEAQVAGEEYMGAFSSSDGETKHPVLHLLAQYFRTYHPAILLIVSGTGFSLPVFMDIMGSNVSKATILPLVVHSTSDFFNQDVQLSYVCRYLPPTFLASDSGKHLKTCIQQWLWGRCVATEVLESQLNHPL